MIKHVSDEEMQLRQTLAQTVKELRMVVASIEFQLSEQEDHKEWIELTGGQISDIWRRLHKSGYEEKDIIEFGFAIENALRERNGD